MAEKISLEGRLDHQAAAKLLESLNGAKGGPVEVDAGEVSLIGGQCLQILLSAAEQWRADGQDFTVCNPSTAFQENLSTLGVAPDLLPVAEAAS